MKSKGATKAALQSEKSPLLLNRDGAAVSNMSMTSAATAVAQRSGDTAASSCIPQCLVECCAKLSACCATIPACISARLCCCLSWCEKDEVGPEATDKKNHATDPGRGDTRDWWRSDGDSDIEDHSKSQLFKDPGNGLECSDEDDDVDGFTGVADDSSRVEVAGAADDGSGVGVFTPLAVDVAGNGNVVDDRLDFAPVMDFLNGVFSSHLLGTGQVSERSAKQQLLLEMLEYFFDPATSGLPAALIHVGFTDATKRLLNASSQMKLVTIYALAAMHFLGEKHAAAINIDVQSIKRHIVNLQRNIFLLQCSHILQTTAEQHQDKSVAATMLFCIMSKFVRLEANQTFPDSCHIQKVTTQVWDQDLISILINAIIDPERKSALEVGWSSFIHSIKARDDDEDLQAKCSSLLALCCNLSRLRSPKKIFQIVDKDPAMRNLWVKIRLSNHMLTALSGILAGETVEFSKVRNVYVQLALGLHEAEEATSARRLVLQQVNALLFALTTPQSGLLQIQRNEARDKKAFTYTVQCGSAKWTSSENRSMVTGALGLVSTTNEA